MNSKWCLAIGILVMLAPVAFARDVELRGSLLVDSPGFVGVVVNDGGAVATEGDVVYGSTVESGYYFRPFPGYRDYDDIHLEAGPRGDLLYYTLNVFGSSVTGSDAGSPFTATVALWTDSAGDPSAGIPDTMIPGTDCVFVDVPTGSSTLQCSVPAGISIPDGLWLSFETTTDNSGWKISDFDTCPTTGPPGFSEDFWAEEDLIFGGFSFFWFGGCPANPQSSFVATIVVEGPPWACCDTTTHSCANVFESECAGVFTEGTLCNNLPEPCSEAGACCDTATGACENTFASLCDGYLQAFTAGSLCVDIDCPVPENVPTLTQWGMIVLTVMLLAGLTIKFGRRRTVTA